MRKGDISFIRADTTFFSFIELFSLIAISAYFPLVSRLLGWAGMWYSKRKYLWNIWILDSQYMSKKYILMRLSEALWKVIHKNPYTYTEKFLYILRMNVNLRKCRWQFHVNSRTSSKWNNPRELLVFWIKYLLMLPLVHL